MVIDPDHLRIVLQLLAEQVPELEVWAFGSRVHGHPKPHSDLDLALVSQAPLDLDRLARLSLAFEDSDLPFRVDLVEWSTASPAFRGCIERQHEVIQRGPRS
jgi:predicted nucleotidyltransferase